MRKRLLMMFAVGCLAVVAAAGTAIAAGGDSDAAHACQQGGYLTMHRSDGSSFKNVGDCVSYFAHGGTAGAACTVVPGVSGCMTFANVAMYDGESGDTITLNGSFSFSTTACVGIVCDTPNDYATGGGTYTIADSSGNVLESGTLVADNTTGTDEGLAFEVFYGALGDSTTCAAAAISHVEVNASTGNATDPGITIEGLTPVLARTSAGGLFIADDSSGVTFSC